MDEGKREQLFEGAYSPYTGDVKCEDAWVVMEGGDYDARNTPSSSTSSVSTISNGSLSSLDTTDDASSSTSSSSSADSNGPLYELSDLMAQLPIKRGLSKHYQGKCQSFTSLSRVTSIEDLAKKETPYRRKMKACKSHEGGLDSYKSYTLPKLIISKKPSRSSLSSSLLPNRRGSFLSSCRLR